MKGHTMKNLASITATIAATVVVLFCGYPAYAKDIPLQAGRATVGLKQTKGSTWQVDISLSKSDIYEDLLIAPLNTPVAGNRYELLRSDGKRIAKAAFTITLSQQRPSQHVAVIRKNQRRIAREILRITISNDQKVSVQPVRWHSIISDISHGTDYTINMRPGVNPWLGQGHCSIQWQPARSKTSISTIRWEISKREKIPDQFTDVPRAFLPAIPLAMNNRAVLLGEAGKYSEAEKVLEQADTIASYLGLRVDLRAVLWLNRGIFAYTAGKRTNANQHWRRSMLYPKEHVGIAGALSLMVRRRMETLQMEVGPDLRLVMLGEPRTSPPWRGFELFLGPFGRTKSSIIERKVLALGPAVLKKMKTAMPVAISLGPESVFLVVRDGGPKSKDASLLELSMKDASLLGQTKLQVPVGPLVMEVGKAGIWIVSSSEAKVLRCDRKGKQTSIVSIPLGALGGRHVAGQFFDGTNWWILVSDSARGLSGKLNLTLYQVSEKPGAVKKMFTMAMPKEVSRVVGLQFATPTMADVLAEETTDLKGVRRKVETAARDVGDPLILSMGGAVRVSFLQIREAAKANEGGLLAIYRWQKSGKSRKTVLKNLSGKAFGMNSGPGRPITAYGTHHVNCALLVRQDVLRSTEQKYTIAILDRLHAVKSVIPLTERCLDTPDSPILAFNDDMVAWYSPGAGGIHLIAHKADKGWTPPGPDTYWPTKDRPIIVKRGKLLFGGLNGTKRDTMQWRMRPFSKTVSPEGKLAAVIHSVEGQGTSLTLLDPNRRTVRKIELSKQARVGAAWISNKGHAVVRVGRTLKENRELVMSGSTTALPMWDVVYVGVGEKPRKVAAIDHACQMDGGRVLDDGRWVALIYRTDKRTFELIAMRGPTRLWKRDIQKKRKSDSGFTMSMTRTGQQMAISVHSSQRTYTYDLDGKLKSVRDWPRERGRE